MTRGRARFLAGLIFAVVVALSALWIFLNLAYADSPRPPDDPGPTAGAVALVLAMLFVGVGGLIVRRHPGNAVGWIFCGLGFIYAEGLALEKYSWVAADQADPWPFMTPAAWMADVTFESPALFGLFVFFFLLFPDGKLPTRRWMVLGWVAGVSIGTLFINTAFRPAVLNTIPIQNPLGIEALRPVREILDIVSFAALVMSLFASVASLIVRLRRSKGDERQQIKWFLTAAATLTTMIALAPFTFFTPHVPRWLWPAVLLTCLALIPLAAGVAILKYRLYEIDVIINRALVYGVLTALLAALYLTIIVVLQAALRSVTADSDLAVAASTLAVAAAFRPLRTRVQGFIDRRFYRRKYDAAETLEGFASTLRDEVDLDSLRHELLTAVASTMQPAHVSVWLRHEKEVAPV